MKLLRIFLIFIVFILLNKNYFSQLSGIGISYRNSLKTPISNELKNVIDHGVCLNFDKYLHRFWSTSVFLSHSTGTFNNQILDPGFGGMSDSYQNLSAGINFNYWFLNDLRLLGQRSRKSCKGKIVALNYKFKAYISGGISTDFYITQNQKDLFLYSYCFGLGFNLWQFSLSRQPNIIRPHTKHLLIPFLKVDYHRSLNDVLLFNSYNWRPKGFLIYGGLKIAFNN